MKYLILFLILPNILQAQDGQFIKDQLIKDFERARIYIKEYMDAMPDDKYDFRAHDSIRSFAQQMLHIAQSNVNLGSNGTGAARPFTGRVLENIRSAQSADSVEYYVIASYDFILESLRSMDPARLSEKIKRGPFEETRYAWLLKAFEHQAHHRAQTTIYLRLLGFTPPSERLF